MAGFMKLVAVLAALVFVLTLPATILAFDIGQVLFSEDRIKPILVDQLAASDELRQTLVTNFLSGSGAGPTNPGQFDLAPGGQSLSPGGGGGNAQFCGSWKGVPENGWGGLPLVCMHGRRATTPPHNP